MIGLVLACARPPSMVDGTSPAVAMSAYQCEHIDAPMRDWCAIATLSLDAGSGTEILAFCDRLREPDAVDRCLEMAVRHTSDPAPASACERIRSPSRRGACWARAAQNSAAQDLAVSVALCQRLRVGSPACVASVLEARASTLPALEAEFTALAAIAPDLTRSPDVGGRLGRVASALGADASMDPCPALASGQGVLACRAALIAASAPADRADGG